MLILLILATTVFRYRAENQTDMQTQVGVGNESTILQQGAPQESCIKKLNKKYENIAD